MALTAAKLTDQDRQAIERAVAEAESRTSAELVVVTAEQSGRYDRAEDLFGLLLALLAVAAAWVMWQGVRPDTGDWSVGLTTTLSLPVVLILIAGWAAAGAALATWQPMLARPFITRAHMDVEVRRRGAEVFLQSGVAGTAARRGVLIFVSLFEHMVFVCGDDAVNRVLPQETWDGLARDVAAGFRAGRPADAIAGAVRQVAGLLEPHFPPEAGDTNELPDRVRPAV
ncbi:MAG TPA: TPM domain-containing protein [Phycisphaerales bacterium]|nr:TPM domain-containing protein [Phycisphaerales bacterium]